MLHASQSHLAANSRSFSHLHCLQQVAWRTVVDVDPSLGGHHATLASPVQNSLRYQDDPRHLHPRPTDGMQNAAAAALEEAFLDPAVDTPPKRSLSSTAKAIHFLAICRAFRSGGTRIRTGDTMIFSPRTRVRVRPALSRYVAYLSRKPALHGVGYPGVFGCVLPSIAAALLPRYC